MSDAGDRGRHETAHGSWPLYFSHAAALNRDVEEQGRLAWIDDVKLRLGIITIGEWQHAEGPPAGDWEVISDHTLELPLGLPPGCRCVISDGEIVSLGGPCPVHSGAAE